MHIFIGWKYNPKIGKWIACVLCNQITIMVVVRKSEAECQEWAEKNLPIFLKGKLPTYG